MNHKIKGRETVVLCYLLTNNAASDSDVELMYSRNLLPPIVSPLGSSLLTVCTQHFHTSGDGFV